MSDLIQVFGFGYGTGLALVLVAAFLRINGGR